eukprot:gene7966-9799_t
MHGAGNDFVVFDTNEIKRLSDIEELKEKQKFTIEELSEISLEISNRKIGVGCDQVIIVTEPSDFEMNQYQMIIFNCDGTQATMCGNGIRCFSKFIIDKNIKPSSSSKISDKQEQKEQIIETLAGQKKTYPIYDHPDNKPSMTMMIKVNMGSPLILKTRENVKEIPIENQLILTSTESYLFRKTIVLENKQTLECILVSNGNPHCVIFLDDNIEKGYLPEDTKLDTMVIEDIAKLLQSNSLFFDSANIEFVQKRLNQKNELDARVYERGAGETLACGTGACAVASASILVNKCNPNSPVKVHMPGGTLHMEWENPNNQSSIIYKTGPATTVFSSIFQF